MAVMCDASAALQREADHRIRNSLQIVAGLLRAQARFSGHVGAAAELLAASHRVMSIAIVHERLYRDPCGGSVALRPFLTSLCLDLERGIGRAGSIRLTVDDLDVPSALATDLGIIATELILNAFKHGHGDVSGDVDVVAHMRGSEFVLSVSNSVCGLPKPIAVAAANEGLGMTLIHRLADQHGAKVKIRSEGSRFTADVIMARARLIAA